MNPYPRADNRIDPNDPVLEYLRASPDPVASISDYSVEIALGQLKEAAELATRDVGGKRWVPGLAIVVVGHKNQVLYCDGYGTRRVDGTLKIGPDTLFACASLSKPVSTTLLAHAGLPKRLAPE